MPQREAKSSTFRETNWRTQPDRLTPSQTDLFSGGLTQKRGRKSNKASCGNLAVRVEWSPLALDRVLVIARYIAKDNRGAAERWVNDYGAAEEEPAFMRAAHSASPRCCGNRMDVMA